MDVTPLISRGQQVIQSYAGSRFKVSGLIYEGSIFVFTDKTVPWAVSKSEVTEFSIEDFQDLLKVKSDIDVILLGCGPKIVFLPASLRAQLKAQGLHVEVMDTGAACRTYNVLMAEGRRVVAALLPV